ncbi:MAG TPA: hypothetical protein RMH99_23625 [Sandaracinaceae bacterium LLY-WYZ-13_1]|nr:hypothetical protein [Sandaracinaceae bacterium LLY-WYZ-13_1]
MRARPCTEGDCLGIADADAPEVRVEVERPFHAGRVTRVVLEDLAFGGEAPVVVDRCQVEGCIDGASVSDCTLPEDAHYCELGPTVPFTGSRCGPDDWVRASLL